MGPEIDFTDFIFSRQHENITNTEGKVVMYADKGRTEMPKPDVVIKSGAVAIIYLKMTPSDRSGYECPVNFPCVYVSMDVGNEMYFDMDSMRSLATQTYIYIYTHGQI